MLINCLPQCCKHDACAGLWDNDEVSCSDKMPSCFLDDHFAWMSQNCGKTCCLVEKRCPADTVTECALLQKDCGLAEVAAKCPRTCCPALIDPKGMNLDDTCGEWAQYCNDANYTKWMTSNCPKTCRSTACDNSVDVNSKCSAANYNQYCYITTNKTNPGEKFTTYVGWMQENCPNLCCNKCLTLSDKPVEDYNCAGQVHYCKDANYSAWMQENCPKTCCLADYGSIDNKDSSAAQKAAAENIKLTSTYANSLSIASSCCNKGLSCGEPAIRDCICALDDYCCTKAWDDKCIGIATQKCAMRCYNTGAMVADGTTSSCCSQGLTCSDTKIRACVCDTNSFFYDKYCCDDGWDKKCIDMASAQCGMVCPSTTALAAAAVTEKNKTITTTSTGDSSCCSPGEKCGDNTIWSCLCDPTKNFYDPWCCSTGWDDQCIGKASSHCGMTCANKKFSSCCTQGGKCNDLAITTCACDSKKSFYDKWCCNEGWDGQCIDKAKQNCGMTCPVSKSQPPTCCGITNTCADSTVRECTCKIDSYCCLAWDDQCSAKAESKCSLKCPAVAATTAQIASKEALSCCGSTCATVAIKDCACKKDDYCCTGWDSTCADTARTSCGADCSSKPENCCKEGQICHDKAIVDCTCKIDDWCCTTGWDTNCIGIATDKCKLTCPAEANRR